MQTRRRTGGAGTGGGTPGGGPGATIAGVRRIHSSPAIASTSSITATGVTITVEAAWTTVGCREEWRGKLGVDAVESEGGEGWRRRRRPRGDANEGSWG